MSQIDIIRLVRRHLGSLLLLATAIVLARFSGFIACEFISKSWDLGAFYAAIFDWSSIQSAFLFGIYAFVLSKSEPFVRAIAPTRAFADMRTYVRRTVYLALSLSAVTMPMLIAAPEMRDGSVHDVGYLLFVAYALATVYVFGRFVRVVRVFTLLERP